MLPCCSVEPSLSPALSKLPPPYLLARRLARRAGRMHCTAQVRRVSNTITLLSHCRVLDHAVSLPTRCDSAADCTAGSTSVHICTPRDLMFRVLQRVMSGGWVEVARCIASRVVQQGVHSGCHAQTFENAADDVVSGSHASGGRHHPHSQTLWLWPALHISLYIRTYRMNFIRSSSCL